MKHIRQMAVAAILGAAFASPSAMANLISDPGFELDNGSWTLEPGTWGIASFDRGVNSGLNAIGSNCIDPGDLSSFAVCFFSQNLTTNPGARYNISFWLYADGLAGGGSNSPNGLQVSFDGNVVDTILNFPSTNPSNSSFDPGGPSTLVTINDVLATTDTTVLQFGGFHNPFSIFVDDVSVEASSAVPVPPSLALLGLGLAGLGFARSRKT
jgi:hypothetical protein